MQSSHLGQYCPKLSLSPGSPSVVKASASSFYVLFFCPSILSLLFILFSVLLLIAPCPLLSLLLLYFFFFYPPIVILLYLCLSLFSFRVTVHLLQSDCNGRLGNQLSIYSTLWVGISQYVMEMCKRCISISVRTMVCTLFSMNIKSN